jgi:hypothetical protein
MIDEVFFFSPKQITRGVKNVPASRKVAGQNHDFLFPNV